MTGGSAAGTSGGCSADGAWIVSGLNLPGRVLTFATRSGDEASSVAAAGGDDGAVEDEDGSAGLETTADDRLRTSDGHLNLRLSVLVACGVAGCAE